MKRWKIALQRVPRQDRMMQPFCPHCGQKLRLTLPAFAAHVRWCAASKAG